MKQKILLAIIILGVLGVMTIAKNYDLEESTDKKDLVDKLFSWTKQLSGNIVSITSYSLEKQWYPPLNETGKEDE